MVDPDADLPEESATTSEREYQDTNYHDEELDIVNDEAERPMSKASTGKKKPRIPPPRRRHYED